ncbi:hypothetical protein LVB77_18735 [Lysobacter sp. 5GHs7-4]|uniref:hypothetical protein n=1 Tax=Lysobacter sp. 5GHs7-4 TaxID=2904253 RepID=UPI001E315E3F|nr:hypothetical protein [Lysobacter sp. 5GHs7-4]UHQ22660.1 hypothetical protein LVB77_18735 [Lysobacter sp. 5GHs7-4]
MSELMVLTGSQMKVEVRFDNLALKKDEYRILRRGLFSQFQVENVDKPGDSWATEAEEPYCLVLEIY